jgi:opacity protein-like surface antigen
MRKFILPLIASLAVATPAMANEGRAEVRGGVVWADGDSEAVAGLALGYDFDLGESAFLGGEVSADKVLADNTEVVFGLTGRAGVKAGEKTKLYVDGGFSFSESDDAWHAGAGIEHKLTDSVYGKVFYRHHFDDVIDTDSVGVGVGVKF